MMVTGCGGDDAQCGALDVQHRMQSYPRHPLLQLVHAVCIRKFSDETTPGQSLRRAAGHGGAGQRARDHREMRWPGQLRLSSSNSRHRPVERSSDRRT